MEQEQLYNMLRDKALADGQRFVFLYTSTGNLGKEQLADWLTAFNSWLIFTGKQLKEERDYRRHFAAWFVHHDPRNEDPLQYNPASGNGVQLSMQFYPKTMPLPVTLPPEQPTGKFSKGDNKFDMYWLKNLRDEVRRMGS